MKKVLFFLSIITTLILTSCHKSSVNVNNITAPPGSIVAKIDGVETFLNTKAYATIDTIPWTFYQKAVILSIKGNKDTSSNSENILIWFFVTPVERIGEGTYPDLNKQIYEYLELNSLWNGNLYNYASNIYADTFYSSVSTIVRIDSLVQGVFYGNAGIGAGAVGSLQPPLYHKITEGQFNVKIIN